MCECYIFFTLHILHYAPPGPTGLYIFMMGAGVEVWMIPEYSTYPRAICARSIHSPYTLPKHVAQWAVSLEATRLHVRRKVAEAAHRSWWNFQMLDAVKVKEVGNRMLLGLVIAGGPVTWDSDLNDQLFWVSCHAFIGIQLTPEWQIPWRAFAKSKKLASSVKSKKDAASSTPQFCCFFNSFCIRFATWNNASFDSRDLLSRGCGDVQPNSAIKHIAGYWDTKTWMAKTRGIAAKKFIGFLKLVL